MSQKDLFNQPRRPFHQAAFQFACEMSGTHNAVTIDDKHFASVTSVCLREDSDDFPPAPSVYQLTCFAIGGDWSQLTFDTRGNLLNEIFGPPTGLRRSPRPGRSFEMRKGGHRTWSDAPLPLGTVRIHGGKRRIKVNVDGPKLQRWKDYARFWWEQYRGPVPDGMRVVCLDGNPLNDAPDNLALMTGGEWIVHLRKIRPAVAAKNRRACRAFRVRFNRESARLKRWTRDWPPNRWFPVNLVEQVIFDAPRRMRWQALAAAGVEVDRNNWRFARRIVAGGPIVALRGSQLRDERYRGFLIKEI